MSKSEKNKTDKNEDEILGRDIPTVETAQSEKQKLAAEIDRLALNIAGEKKKLVEQSEEIFARHEGLFGEFENKVVALQKDVADLQVTEKVQGVMNKIEKFRKKAENLDKDVKEVVVDVGKAVEREGSVQDKNEVPAAVEPVEPPVELPAEPVLPAATDTPAPSAPDNKEIKQTASERFNFEGGILKTPNFSLDLNPLLDGGKCEMRMENGVLYVDGKDEFYDTRAKLELSRDKKGVVLKIRQNEEVVWNKDYLPDYADFAKIRLESTFIKKVVKKVESVADKKTVVEPVKKVEPAPVAAATTAADAPVETEPPALIAADKNDGKADRPDKESTMDFIEGIITEKKLRDLKRLLDKAPFEQDKFAKMATTLAIGLPRVTSNEYKNKEKELKDRPNDLEKYKDTLEEIEDKRSTLSRDEFGEFIKDVEKSLLDAYWHWRGFSADKDYTAEKQGAWLKEAGKYLNIKQSENKREFGDEAKIIYGRVKTAFDGVLGNGRVGHKNQFGQIGQDIRALKAAQTENPALYKAYLERVTGTNRNIDLLFDELENIETDEELKIKENDILRRLDVCKAELRAIMVDFDHERIPVELGTPEDAEARAEKLTQEILNFTALFNAVALKKYWNFEEEIDAYEISHPEAVEEDDEQLKVVRAKIAEASDGSKSITDPEAVEGYFSGKTKEIDELIEDFRRKRVEAADESGERTYTPETVSENQPEAPAEDLLERFDKEKAGEVQRRNEILRDLQSKLTAARENLANAFAEKEKAGGFVGSFKKMFGSKERELSESRFNFAWNEYSRLQQELLEASEKQAGELGEFLQMESAELQSRLGEYYKGKENVVSKAWRKLGDMNLHNFLEKKGAEAKQKTEQGEALGRWDSFWANRADEYSKSHTLYKLGAKAISARTLISLGLMGGGILGFTGAAEARGAFVGIGAAVGSRQVQDAVQNKMQRWLGNRGEFYGTRAQAEEALRAKYGIVEKHYDEGAAVDEPEDKKTARRRAKFEKELKAVSEKVNAKDKLPVAEQLAKIQEKIAAVKAYAYVNGLDLSKDDNYARLMGESDRLINALLNERAKAIGDTRNVLRPDNSDDAIAFFASRKAELDKTAGKISAEKRLRWGKRIISVAVGATLGTFAYFATLNRAAAFGNGPKEAAAGAVAGKTTEYGAIPSSHDTTPIPDSQTVEAPPAPMGEQAIPDKFLVHKGDGLERVLQRQLLDDPQKFGYTEQMGDVKRWAGHEASVIAQKQGIADKYFIYNEKNPQYLVLNDDRTVTTIGRMHDEAEIVASKARVAAEMGQEHGEKSAPVREVIDAKTGEPKFMTDLEKDQVDKLWDEGKLSDAMQIMMESKEKGPIFELSDGSFAHQADIAGTSVTAEALPVSDTVTTGGAGALSPVEHAPVPKEGVPGAEQAKPTDFDELVKGGEMKPLGSFDSRHGHQVFEYENGKAVAFKSNFVDSTIPAVEDAARQVFKISSASPARDVYVSAKTGADIRIAAVYENIYRDLAAKGFQNSTEAQMLKERIADNARSLAEDLSKKPGELFKDDYLRTFGMKDEIIGSAEISDEEAMRLLRGE